MATSDNCTQLSHTYVVRIKKVSENNFISVTPLRTWSESRNIIPRKIFKRVEATGPDGKKKKFTSFVASDRFAPITLPEEVVRLFQQPHQFPRFGPDEMLVKAGYLPRIMFDAPLNSVLFSKETMTFDEKRIRAIVKHRETLQKPDDHGLPALLEEFRVKNVHDEERQKIEIIGKETFKVPYRNGFVFFRPVRVDIIKLRPSVVEYYMTKNSKNSQQGIEEI